jgi:hypothetical protein
MNNLIKFTKKFLMSEPFIVDGFEYQFISVEPYEDFGIEITVNVILPKKGQSYVIEKFSYDIYHILENMNQYYGTTISYQEVILVEGQLPKRRAYINEEDQDEIINTLNGDMSNFSITHMSSDYGTYKVRGGLSWKKIDRKFYEINEEIDFYFYYDVSDVVVNNGELSVNPTKIDEFASTLNDRLQDNDQFRDKIQDNIYRVLEPSVKIENLEVYFNANYFLKRINGKQYDSTQPYLGFKSFMFIE